MTNRPLSPTRRRLLAYSALVPAALLAARPAIAQSACGFDPLPTRLDFAVDATVITIGALVLISAPAWISVASVAGAAVMITGSRMFYDDLKDLTNCNIRLLDHMINGPDAGPAPFLP